MSIPLQLQNVNRKSSYSKSDASRFIQTKVPGPRLKTNNPSFLLSTLKNIRKLRLHVTDRTNRSQYLPGYYTIGVRANTEIVSARIILQSLFRFNKWIQLITQHHWTLCITAKDVTLGSSLNVMFEKNNIIGSLYNNWIPGSISNKAQIQRSKSRLADTLPVKRNIDFIFILNRNNVIYRETEMYNIPVIGFVTTKHQMLSFFLPLFGALDNLSVIKFYLTNLYCTQRSLSRFHTDFSHLWKNI